MTGAKRSSPSVAVMAVSNAGLAAPVKDVGIKDDAVIGLRLAFKPLALCGVKDRVLPWPARVKADSSVGAVATEIPGVDRALAIMFQPMTEGMRASPVTVVVDMVGVT